MTDSGWSAEPQLVDNERAAFETTLLDRLRDVYGANPWVIAVEVDQGAVRLAAGVHQLGGAPAMAVGARSGIGPIDDSVPLVSMGLPHEDTFFADIGSAHAALAAPTAEHQAVVDEWDPDGAARAIGSLTAVQGTVMGRRTFGARPESWRALEDKLAIEELWHAAGIPVAPSAHVDLADLDRLLAVHERLATEHGTVWAGDNSSGWHGGGSGTYWVPDRAAVEHRAAELSRFERARVMPFVDGVPCSIHGMVIPDGAGGTDVLAFRPAEMMVLRDRATHRFVYGRSANFWDPAPEDRASMRTTAGLIGLQLDQRVGFRGVFTVDGVLGADGFVPTEVNPRYGAALAMMHPTTSGDPLSLFLLNLAVVEGVMDDLDLRPLGPLITASLDANRGGAGFIHTSVSPRAEVNAVIHRGQDGTLVVADETDRPVAEVAWAPAGDGGLAIVSFQDVPIGPPTAPLLVEIAKLVDDHWSMELEPLTAASSVR